MCSHMNLELVRCFAVGRILRKHYDKNNPNQGNGPSWLSFIGHMKDSLWSVDLFRCESILLKSIWVMIIIDQYTRKIIGLFSPCWRLRWKANMNALDITEIKSIATTPVSHPFVERAIRTTRNELLDQVLFFNKYDLQNKLNNYQQYYNETRAHSSLGMNTPKEMASGEIISRKCVSIDNYAWQSYCRELYKFPITA